jgi:phospholipid N-methyltransferase
VAKKRKKLTPIEHEEQYVAFLKRRLESENFLANATQEEIELTKQKYDKAKFKLKMLKEEQSGRSRRR